MFDQHRAHQGRADGEADAALGRPSRPRPDLLFAVAFSGYRDTYLSTYRDAYRQRMWQEERLRSEGMATRAHPKPTVRRTNPRSALRREVVAFDAGWRDGENGAEASPAKAARTPEETAAYARGYRIGVRDRDFKRAKQLRAQKARDHDRGR